MESSSDDDQTGHGRSLVVRTYAGRVHGAGRGGRGGEGQDERNESVSLGFLIGVLRNWWKIVVPGGLVMAATATAAVYFLHTPEFEARSILSIESAAPYIAFEKEGQAARSDRYVETQIELMRSPVVLAPLLSNPKIASAPELAKVDDPVAELGKLLSVKQIGRSELYDIRFKSESPVHAQEVVNGVVSQYVSLHTSDDYERSQRVIAVLEEERLRRSNEVDRLRKRVVDLSKEVTGRDPFGQGTPLDVDRALSPVGAVYAELISVDVQREVAKAELEALKDSALLAAGEPLPALDEAQAVLNPVVQGLDAELTALRQRVERIKTTSRHWRDDRDYRRLDAEIKSLEEHRATLVQSIQEDLHQQQLESRTREQQRQIAEKQQEVASLEAEAALLKSKYAEQVDDLKDGGAKSVQLEFARAELLREEKVFELIAARKLALQTELRAPARVQRMQSAATPKVAIEPIPFKLMGVASLVGLVCPAGLAVARELTVKRVSSTDQLIHESRLPVLAEVAHFPSRPVAGGVRRLSKRAQQEMFVFAESIDSLRTTLMLSEAFAGKADRRVLAVVSASSGEGKTSVATSLAMSFAAATKKRTLLIDADLRSPDAAEVLGAPNDRGLVDVIEGQLDVSDAIRRVGETTAYVLPAGRSRQSPHHVLHSEKVAKLLRRLTDFAYVIIDTPPLLSASESLVLSKAADMVVYCSLRDVSRAAQVRTAVMRLSDARANIAGAVLSGMPVSSYERFYGVYGHPMEAPTIE